MANMIPDKPMDFSPASLEDIMFDALAKLPDDYYVFHSFRIVTNNSGVLAESETDFVIFNRTLGVLCIEAKAGRVYYDNNGTWKYGSGKEMSHGGPYNQASGNKYKLIEYCKARGYGEIIKKCKFLHAVWFPSISEEDINGIQYPSEGERSITLSAAALLDPYTRINRVFDIQVPSGIVTNLDNNEEKSLLEGVLCPSTNVVPSISLKHDLTKAAFHRLLEEQVNILNYLEEQKVAVINGVAGTGKTMIAIEKARRHAVKKEKVLFLCYNRMLSDYLVNVAGNEYIDIYTIDGYACKICHTTTPDYSLLKCKVEELYMENAFAYQHIIIDEGQDFGQDEIMESEVIELMADIVSDNTTNGSFYVFYDKLQLVQGRKIPSYILEADCKLTLYKNCRNTVNIATTSMRPLTNVSPQLYKGAVAGAIPHMYFTDSKKPEEQIVDNLLVSLRQERIEDVIILTCKTENTSCLALYIADGRYKNKCKFTTCRKYKGLEADAVILVDALDDAFLPEKNRLFYVGASRARLSLFIVTSLSEENCKYILTQMGRRNDNKKPQKELCTALNARYLSSC